MRICNKCNHELEDGAKKCPYCNAWQYVPPTEKQDTFNMIVVVGAVVLSIILLFYWCYSKGAL